MADVVRFEKPPKPSRGKNPNEPCRVILPDVSYLACLERERQRRKAEQSPEAVPASVPPAEEDDESDCPHHYPGGPAGLTPNDVAHRRASASETSKLAESVTSESSRRGATRTIANRVRTFLRDRLTPGGSGRWW